MAYDSERKVWLGKVYRRGEEIRFGIKEQDRARHIYVIGQTGTGKSTLLEVMAAQDLANNEGIIFMDPHGQSVEYLLECVTPNSLDNVIYFAPHLQDRPIGLNIMEDVGYDSRHRVVSSLMASFEKIWGASTWSDRMAYILQNTLLALLEYPDTTLLDVGRMYASKDYRNKVVENVKDPQVRKYWVDEYANYSDRYVQDATPAIQNKLGQFTSNPLMRNIIGQTKSAFNFRDVIDSGKMLLVNLSKGQIGGNNARMLGVLFTTKIYLAALSRSDLSREGLAAACPCNFYVDEFQSFANSTFSDILSEARKYKLQLVLAHQYIGQLYSDSGDAGDGNAIRDAVFGNVGTFMSFRVGPVDAEIIAKQFAPYVTEEDLVALPRFHMYLTLNIDGVGSTPFLASTFDRPTPQSDSLAGRTVEQSLQKYGVERSVIEERVRKNIESDWKSDTGGSKGGGDKKGGWKNDGGGSKARFSPNNSGQRKQGGGVLGKVLKKVVKRIDISSDDRDLSKSGVSREALPGEREEPQYSSDTEKQAAGKVATPAGGSVSPSGIHREKKGFREGVDSGSYVSEKPLTPAPNVSAPREKKEPDRSSDSGGRGDIQKSGPKSSVGSTPPDARREKKESGDGQREGSKRRDGDRKRRADPVALGSLIKGTRMSGFEQDATVKPKEGKSAPPVDYEDGWVSLGDLQSGASRDGTDSDDA